MYYMLDFLMHRYQIPEDWPYQEARRLFKEPLVTNDSEELKWTPPDEEVSIGFNVALNKLIYLSFLFS